MYTTTEQKEAIEVYLAESVVVDPRLVAATKPVDSTWGEEVDEHLQFTREGTETSTKTKPLHLNQLYIHER